MVFEEIFDLTQQSSSRAIKEYQTKLAKMIFEEIFDLTAVEFFTSFVLGLFFLPIYLYMGRCFGNGGRGNRDFCYGVARCGWRMKRVFVEGKEDEARGKGGAAGKGVAGVPFAVVGLMSVLVFGVGVGAGPA